MREECRSGTALIELPSVFTSRGFLYLYFRLLPGHTRAKLAQPALCNSLSRGGMNGRKLGGWRGVGEREASGCVAPERVVDVRKEKWQENEKEQEPAGEREKVERGRRNGSLSERMKFLVRPEGIAR